MKTKRDIEKSIIKTYRKTIWSRLVRAIKDFELIKENDCVAVCISGGKDSMLLAKCLEELKKHGQIAFDLKFIVMDPGYDPYNLERIKENCKLLGIEAHFFESHIFDALEQTAKEAPCYLCARMRRGHLYNKAKELGCNKIALGHHFNDVIETIMLNIFYAGQFKSMMPKVRSDNFEGMELIRPLYYVKEDDIKAWAKYNELSFLNCGCVLTRQKLESKRREMKELIKQLKLTNDNVDIAIMRASENVNIDTIIGYYKDNKYHHFLDEYDSN